MMKGQTRVARIALSQHQLSPVGNDAAAGSPVLSLEPELDGDSHGADHEVLEARGFADFAGEFDGGVRVVGGEIEHLVAVVTTARHFGLAVREHLYAVGSVDESGEMEGRRGGGGGRGKGGKEEERRNIIVKSVSFSF